MSDTVETGTTDTQAFLDSFGFKDMEQATQVLNSYKTDVKDLKSKNKTNSEATKELEAFKAKAEENRQAELSEVDRLKEQLGERDSKLQSLEGSIAQMTKDRLYDSVMFEHSKDKTLSKTRGKLYSVAVKSTEWNTAEELQEILIQVDTDFDTELGSINSKLPAPGDNNNTKPTQGENTLGSLFYR